MLFSHGKKGTGSNNSGTELAGIRQAQSECWTRWCSADAYQTAARTEVVIGFKNVLAHATPPFRRTFLPAAFMLFRQFSSGAPPR